MSVAISRVVSFRSVGTFAVLASFLAAGCGGSSSDSGPPVGTEAAETAAAMAELGIEGLEGVLSFEGDAPAAVAVVDSGTSLAQSFLRRSGIFRFLPEGATGDGVASAVAACGSGGTITSDCTVDGSVSTLSVTASNCVEDDFGTVISMNGNMTMSTEDPTACADELDSADDVSISLNSFQITTRVGGNIVGSLFMDGDLSFVEGVDPGCMLDTGTLTADYIVRFFSAEDGEDITVEATNLTMTITTATSPCQDTIAVDGTLYVDNRVTGRRMRQTYNGFTVVLEPVTGGVELTLSGETSLNCMGAVTFVTNTPLFIADGDDCATSGELLVTIVDTGEVALVTYNGDGSVDIDLGNDGSVDRSRACGAVRPACTS